MLVVLNGEIHATRFGHNGHTSSLALSTIRADALDDLKARRARPTPGSASPPPSRGTGFLRRQVPEVMTGNAWVAMLVEEPGFDVLAEKELTEAISDVAGSDPNAAARSGPAGPRRSPGKSR